VGRIPTLMWHLFPEDVEMGMRAASARLLLWCEAYEAWLEERRLKSPTMIYSVNLSWRRLLGEVRKMPWEITQGDMEAYADWMGARGYYNAVINANLLHCAEFYRWCSERQVDEECAPGFNPAEKVRRLRVEAFKGRLLLSRQEMERLLGCTSQDTTPLGRRDHAFILARLRLGVQQRRLVRLRWGQIEVEKGDAWVQWREEVTRSRLPVDVWEAILVYLEAGGRLEEMEVEDYVFAPLAINSKTWGLREDLVWQANKYLANCELQEWLKIHGQKAGIPEEKLNMYVLRRTALRVHLDGCPGVDDESKLKDDDIVREMGVFMGNKFIPRQIRRQLRNLPQLPPDEEPQGGQTKPQPKPSVHLQRHMEPEEGVKHGLYNRSQPAQAVLAILEENIEGIDEEFIGLRRLERGLVERMEQATKGQELVMLGEAQSMTAWRVGEMIKVEKLMGEIEESSRWVSAWLELVERFNISEGKGKFTEEERASYLASLMGVDAGEMPEGVRHVAEEVAGLRYVLRKMLKLALETEEVQEHVRLVELYGRGCLRLVKLLRMEGSGFELVRQKISMAIDQALREKMEEWNLSV
jgi:integrase